MMSIKHISFLLLVVLVSFGEGTVMPGQFRMEDMEGPLYCAMDHEDARATLAYAFARNLPVLPSIHTASTFLGRGVENIVNIGKMTELNCTGCVITLPPDWKPEDFVDHPPLKQPEKPFPVPF